MLSIYKLGSILGSIQDHLLGSTKYYRIRHQLHSQSLNQSMCSVIVWQVLGFKAFVHVIVLHGST